MIETNISIAIKNLRIPLALLIVLGHSDILHFPIMSGDNPVLYDQSIIKYFVVYFCRVLFAPANSMFFAISGFLFFALSDKFGTEDYLSKIKKRIKTLFVPYVIWQLIFLFPYLVGIIIGRENHSIPGFIQSIWNLPGEPIPADPPLWFLRDLMVCMLMSPIYYLILKNRRIGLFFISIITLLWLFNIWPLPAWNGLSSLSIVFFALGAFVGIHKVRLSSQIGKYGGSILILFLIASIVDMITTSYQPMGNGNVQVECIIPLNNLIVLLACIVYPYLAIRYNNVFRHLDLGGSFVVYASHWGFLMVINFLINRYCPSVLPTLVALLLFLLRVSFGFFGGLILSRIISRSAFFSKLLAGGRE